MQTNSRAELLAIVVVVQNTEIAGRIDFLIDSRVIRDSYLTAQHRARLSNNADLLTIVSQNIEESM